MSKIVPDPTASNDSHRTGDVCNLTKADIDRILGFSPNVNDDTSKVKYSWGFRVDGQACAIWDYKGSAAFKEWSAFGPAEVLGQIFGTNYTYG